MIKHINHQNFLTTPFVASKAWHLYNRDPDDLVLLEPTGSDDTIALEYTDYSTDDPFVNTNCSIALEQQSSDFINYQEGITGSGKFYPDSEPTNPDGTFKRLVHAQTKLAFYNKYNNPTKIFGLDYIDFPLGKTFRGLSNSIRLFNVPQSVFGERIKENTVVLYDFALDDNITITDDGYQNLIAKQNLFSKVQEVRAIQNIIISGSATYICYNDTVTAAVTDTSYLSIGFVGGSVDNVPTVEELLFTVGFNTGSYTQEVYPASLTGSNSVTASTDVAFLTGSIYDQVITTYISGSLSETGSNDIAFLTGSVFDEVINTYISGSLSETGSNAISFLTGSMILEVKPTSSYESSSVIIGFLNGSIT